MTARRLFPFLAVALCGACAGAPPPPPVTNVAIPIRDTAPKAAPDREPVPESPGPRPFHFPKVTWGELKNGLPVGTIVSASLPIVQVRLIVLGGSSADEEKPGLGMITASMLKEGGAGGLSARDFMSELEALGAELSITTSFDTHRIALTVTKDRLDRAMDLLGMMVGRPRFGAAEFDKLKKREADGLAELARSSGRWGASMVLYRDLFTLPAEHHPYATWSPVATDLTRLTLGDCRAYHQRFFGPKNMFLVIAGDTTPAEAQRAAGRAFGALTGKEPPPQSFTDPLPPAARRITLVDRPKSSQSDVFVGFLGPARRDHEFSAFDVANQVLGGGVTGRLFTDVREKRSLAYAARSTIHELAHGPTVMTAYVGTQTAKTGLALDALLSHLERAVTLEPEAVELETATRFLAEVFAVKLEAIGAVADELVRLRLLDLPDDFDDGYSQELKAATTESTLKAAGGHIRPGHEVIVVSGDASVIGPMLSHFGEVKVLDPRSDFARVKTIPMDGSAALEVPRAPGM